MTKPMALMRTLGMALAVVMAFACVAPVRAESGVDGSGECDKKDPGAAHVTARCGSQWTARYRKPKHSWLQVAEKLAITAGAAAGGALIGSRFGTVGTLTGAAVGAIVGQLLGSHFIRPHRQVSYSARPPAMMGDEGECPPEPDQPPVGLVPRRPVYALGANAQPAVQLPGQLPVQPPMQAQPPSPPLPGANEAALQSNLNQALPGVQSQIQSPLGMQPEGQLPMQVQLPGQIPMQVQAPPQIPVQGPPQLQRPAPPAANAGGDAAALKSKLNEAMSAVKSAATDGSDEDRMAAKSRYDEAWKAYTSVKSGSH
jgi:hypothetical protein